MKKTIFEIFEQARVDGTTVRIAEDGNKVCVNGDWFRKSEYRRFVQHCGGLFAAVNKEFIR